MTWVDFWLIFLCCLVTMLICRVVPLFVLKERKLPENLEIALNFIPPAAFAALVANDLLTPGMFAGGLWPAAAPLLASVAVIVVALKTKSLLWCAITGCVVYALLLFLLPA